MHDDLYKKLNTFQSRLEIVDDICELVVRAVILNPSCPLPLQTLFKGLYEDSESIAKILREEGVTEDTFEDSGVKKILEENFKRLKRRNFCLASFSYQDGEDEKIQNVPVILDGKPLIFISGIGNEIIRILEKTSLFKNFSYGIFHGKEEIKNNSMSVNYFDQILSNLYVNTLPLLTQGSMRTLTASYKKEALKLSETKKLVESVKNGGKEGN